MESKSDFTWDEALNVANTVVLQNTGKYLSDHEVKILEGSWNGQTYQEIADSTDININSTQYIGEIGQKLWEKLSEALREQVSKNNFKEALRRKWESRFSENSFYVDRPPIESQCYEKIAEPGGLIRIKAPRKMGKSLLINKIYDKAEELGYETVILSFDKADSQVFSNYHQFCQWFCLAVGQQLELDNKLAEYWDDSFLGINSNATNYFQQYLLAQRSTPLVLVLMKFDLVCEQTEINIDFCRLLRDWHETAKRSGRSSIIWKKLRLIISHSTEFYRLFDFNASPLNGVGFVPVIRDFNLKEILELSQRYQLRLKPEELNQIMAMFGGYPYLVKEAFSYLRNKQFSLEYLLQIVTTEASPFISDLRQLLGYLKQSPELAAAYKEVLDNHQPMQLDTFVTMKLESMGLIKIDNNNCYPRCDLYREYFLPRL